ncbi:MAG: hypothetical protein IJ301_04415 [Clostridia bacterium]|nr:hypothetical protein [Clostridia bacterium]
MSQIRITPNCVSLSNDLKADSQIAGAFIRAYDPPLPAFLDVCSSYAYIKHNEGEPHYHVCCTFKGKQRVARLISLYGSRQNMSIGKLTKGSACLEYLTHMNDANKVQYSIEDIVSENLEELQISTEYTIESDKSEKVKKRVTNEMLVEDVQMYYERKISAREMALKYGRDFIINQRKYREFGQILSTESRVEESIKLMFNAYGDVDVISQLMGEYVSNYMIVEGEPPSSEQIRKYYILCRKHFENNNPYETEEECRSEIEKSMACL